MPAAVDRPRRVSGAVPVGGAPTWPWFRYGRGGTGLPVPPPAPYPEPGRGEEEGAEHDEGAAVPATPAISPAEAGAATCPRRFPVSRRASAVERASAGAARTTVVIESGCPTPRQKPSTASITASTATGTGRAMPAHSTPASRQVVVSSAARPRTRSIGVITSRQAMVAAARRLSSSPTVAGAMPRCSPTTGRYAVRMSVAESTARLMKIPAGTPRARRMRPTGTFAAGSARWAAGGDRCSMRRSEPRRRRRRPPRRAGRVRWYGPWRRPARRSDTRRRSGR